MTNALERHEQALTKVCPIMSRPVYFERDIVTEINKCVGESCMMWEAGDCALKNKDKLRFSAYD